jgi:serine-type D-Ala-D-Ala carboxypeptidase/endopeptidase (penicillin-binding protein 4)
VLRRHYALLAVFLVSGLSTWAGTAGASADPPEPGFDPGLDDAPKLVPGSVLALVEGSELAAADAPAASASGPDWPQVIDARLAALARSERALAQPARARDRRLDARIAAILRGLEREARASVEVRDLDSGAILVSHAGERALNPASNQKLITAIAAVELLGPDYRFTTTVARVGDRLIVRGEGDPDLHLADLHRLAAQVIAAGAHEGVTAIVVDDRAFDGQQLGPGFRSDGPGDSYVAPSGALAIEFGTVQVTVRPGPWRGPAQLSVEPDGAAIELINRASTGIGELQVSTRRGDAGETIVEVDGSIAAGHAPITVRRRVGDPGLLAASAFAELLAVQLGAPALPVARVELGPDRAEPSEVIAVHRSAPLLAVLASALRYSNNFTAEQVLRTLAWRATGEPGSWADGVAVLERFAAAVSPAASEQRFVNGSGLSHEGRLSPRFLGDVLGLVARRGSPAEVLLASFAAAGGEGTLHYRLAPAGARVLAKTGTYAGASSLSGVVTRADGRRLGFSILINGGELDRNRAAQDRIVAALLR